MQLIYANRPGTPIAPVRELTATEDGALRGLVTGEMTRQSDELLRHAWQHRWWFACDCRPHGANPPILFVRKTYSGHLELSQMTDRPGHTKHCPFANKIAIHTLDEQTIATALPPLGELLLRWLTAAKLNVAYPYVASDVVSKQYHSLRDMAKSLSLEPGRKLSDYARTHPDGVPNLVAFLRKQQQSAARQSDAGPPWGVLFGVADEIHNGRMQLGNLNLELPPTAIHMPIDAATAGGPFAVLVKYGATEEGQFGPTEVFAQPVFSTRHLVPVDYAHERRTLKTLLSLQRKMLAEKDVVVVIRKTLPSVQAHDRGIAFQLSRLGPNGKAAREVDVLTIDVTDLPERLPAASQPDDIVYHLVKRDVEFHDLDRRFFAIVFARLLDGLTLPSRPSSVVEAQA